MFKFTGIKEEKGGKYRQCYIQHSKKGRRWVSWKTFHNPIAEIFYYVKLRKLCVKLIDITRKSFDCQML